VAGHLSPLRHAKSLRSDFRIRGLPCIKYLLDERQYTPPAVQSIHWSWLRSWFYAARSTGGGYSSRKRNTGIFRVQKKPWATSYNIARITSARIRRQHRAFGPGLAIQRSARLLLGCYHTGECRHPQPMAFLRLFRAGVADQATAARLEPEIGDSGGNQIVGFGKPNTALPETRPNQNNHEYSRPHHLNHLSEL